MRSEHEELHVKWKGRSHIHCSWLSSSRVQDAYVLVPGLKQKVQKFWATRQSDDAADAEEMEETGGLMVASSP